VNIFKIALEVGYNIQANIAKKLRTQFGFLTIELRKKYEN
jgi:hypothetical protein